MTQKLKFQLINDARTNDIKLIVEVHTIEDDPNCLDVTITSDRGSIVDACRVLHSELFTWIEARKDW
jgi:hypothetical protein